MTGVVGSRGRLRETSGFSTALRGRSWVWRVGGWISCRGRAVAGVELELVEPTLDWISGLLGVEMPDVPISKEALEDAFPRACL